MVDLRDDLNAQPLNLIAIADDDVVYRFALKQLIPAIKQSRLIIDSSNGQELVEKIESSKIKPSICLLDTGMPIMNGFATLPVLKEKWPSLKIIITANNSSKFSINSMLINGADGYILKTDSLANLENIFNAIGQQGVYYSSQAPKTLFEKAKEGSLTVPEITDREMEALTFICNNLSYEQIAQKMSISRRTVEVHRDNLYKKLQVSNKLELLRFALQNELILLNTGSK